MNARDSSLPVAIPHFYRLPNKHVGAKSCYQLNTSCLLRRFVHNQFSGTQVRTINQRQLLSIPTCYLPSLHSWKIMGDIRSTKRPVFIQRLFAQNLVYAIQPVVQPVGQQVASHVQTFSRWAVCWTNGWMNPKKCEVILSR